MLIVPRVFPRLVHTSFVQLSGAESQPIPDRERQASFHSHDVRREARPERQSPSRVGPRGPQPHFSGEGRQPAQPDAAVGRMSRHLLCPPQGRLLRVVRGAGSGDDRVPCPVRPQFQRHPHHEPGRCRSQARQDGPCGSRSFHRHDGQAPSGEEQILLHQDPRRFWRDDTHFAVVL